MVLPARKINHKIKEKYIHHDFPSVTSKLTASLAILTLSFTFSNISVDSIRRYIEGGFETVLEYL